MSKDNPVLDSPDLEVFRREEWINIKKKWSTSLPSYVQAACNKAFSIPLEITKEHIPTDNTPPTEAFAARGKNKAAQEAEAND